MKSKGDKAMEIIYNLLNSEESCDVVDCTICAIVGEWKFYDDYKAAGQLNFLK